MCASCSSGVKCGVLVNASEVPINMDVEADEVGSIDDSAEEVGRRGGEYRDTRQCRRTAVWAKMVRACDLPVG
jgi:hypothetical protein